MLLEFLQGTAGRIVGNAHDRGPGGHGAVCQLPVPLLLQFSPLGVSFLEHLWEDVPERRRPRDGFRVCRCLYCHGQYHRSGEYRRVATAIVSGGPRAVFWMWVSGCLGMSTKACEIILGQRFRVKYSRSMDEYMCDRSFVMKMPWAGNGEPCCFRWPVSSWVPGPAVSRRNPWWGP